MVAAYDPPASTVPGRAIAYLRSLPPGTQVRTADLVAAIGLELGPTSGLHNYMRAAVKNGAVVQHPDPDDRRRMLWRLDDGTPPDSADAPPPDEPEAPLEPRHRPTDATPRIDQLIAAGAPAVAKAMAALTTPAEFGTAQTVATSELRPGLRVGLFTATGYEPLASVLTRAYAQAAEGKGAQRHAQGQPFNAQPMQHLIRLYGIGFALGQAAKKAQEAQRLPTVERQVAELLGAINYLAGAVIALEAGQSTTTTKD